MRNLLFVGLSLMLLGLVPTASAGPGDCDPIGADLTTCQPSDGGPGPIDACAGQFGAPDSANGGGSLTAPTVGQDGSGAYAGILVASDGDGNQHGGYLLIGVYLANGQCPSKNQSPWAPYWIWYIQSQICITCE